LQCRQDAALKVLLCSGFSLLPARVIAVVLESLPERGAALFLAAIPHQVHDADAAGCVRNLHPVAASGGVLPLQSLHARLAHRPVLPNPPDPLSVSSNSSTSCHSTLVTGAMTSWAMRSPGLMTKRRGLWLYRTTPTSPV